MHKVNFFIKIFLLEVKAYFFLIFFLRIRHKFLVVCVLRAYCFVFDFSISQNDLLGIFFYVLDINSR